MIKNVITVSLMTLLLSYVGSLDGFDITNCKFKMFHRIQEATTWGNLFSEGYEIDIKAAEIAEGKLKGGHFDEKLHTVIPEDFVQTDKEWKQTKDKIAQLIGPIPKSSITESTFWENSSTSVDELLKDAQALAPSFKKDFQEIAIQKGAIANFGPGNEFAIKSHDSLIRKVKHTASTLNQSEAESLSKVGDALRGTIIVDEVKKIPEIINLMEDYADKKGAKVVFKNLWAEERESGYVGIHAKLLLPIAQADGTHYLLAEIQIHLDSMVDGTALSPKERAHLIYENVRLEDSSTAELAAASKLLFLTAMQEELEKLK